MQYNGQQIFVTMTQPSDFMSFSMSPTTAVVNSIQDYEFTLDFQFDHYTDDRIVINLPSGMAAETNYDCSSNTADVYLSCSKNDAENSIYARLALLNNTESISSISFTLSNILSNWFVSSQTIIIQTTTNDTTAVYYVEQGSLTVSFTYATLATSAASDDRIVLTGTSEI